jgi:hypothetical protein
MQLLQRLKNLQASFLARQKPRRYDPRYWDSAMYALYPEAEHRASRRLSAHEESFIASINIPVPF